jgi:hypothetical protein
MTRSLCQPCRPVAGFCPTPAAAPTCTTTTTVTVWGLCSQQSFTASVTACTCTCAAAGTPPPHATHRPNKHAQATELMCVWWWGKDSQSLFMLIPKNQGRGVFCSPPPTPPPPHPDPRTRPPHPHPHTHPTPPTSPHQPTQTHPHTTQLPHIDCGDPPMPCPAGLLLLVRWWCQAPLGLTQHQTLNPNPLRTSQRSVHPVCTLVKSNASSGP